MFEGLFQPWHLMIILVIILIIFGPGKLPDLGSALGKGIREFKKGTQDLGEPAHELSKAAIAKGRPEFEAPVQTTVRQPEEVAQPASVPRDDK